MAENLLSDLIINKIYSVNTIYSEAGEGAVRHNRPAWAFLIKYEGETVYTVGGRQIKSDLQHPVILPKGSDYSWECVEAGHYTVVEFDADGCEKSVISCPVNSGEALLHRFQSLENKWNLKHSFYVLECLKDTYGILIHLLKASEKYLPADKKAKIRPALDYIAAHYAAPITNRQLAEMLGISTVYFRKLFTEAVGVSPIAYIHQLRISKAKEIIKSDCPKMSVIAEMLGYSSIYHFSKMFKQLTGVSPTEYAKSAK